MIVSNVIKYAVHMPNNITKTKINAIDFNGGIKLYD